jgi:5-methyltetrahydrofolate--homocysteine methyltransferase
LQTHVEPILTAWKERCVSEQLLEPKVIYGFFPCQSEGNELIIYQDDLLTERLRFSFPRGGKKSLCLADFFRAKTMGSMDMSTMDASNMDVLALQIVTVGDIARQTAQHLFEAGHYQDYFFYHGLSAEMAEATAEYWHKRIRSLWGIDSADGPTPEKILASEYQGERFSFGYPACPNLADQSLLFELLEPERIGISLTELSLLVPEQSTSALILHHPEAHYFDVGPVTH